MTSLTGPYFPNTCASLSYFISASAPQLATYRYGVASLKGPRGRAKNGFSLAAMGLSVEEAMAGKPQREELSNGTKV